MDKIINKEQIRAKANKNIVYILDKLGVIYNLNASHLTAICPCKHHGGDRNNRLAFSWQMDFSRWICWSHHCEVRHGSDIFALVRSILGVSFPEAVKWIRDVLLNFDDVPITRPQYKQPEIKIHEPVPEKNLKYLMLDPQFLLDRGFDRNVLRDYNVGLWCKPGTFMHNRVVFPIRDQYWFLVGYTGRTTLPPDPNSPYPYRKWIHGRSFFTKPTIGELAIGSLLFNLDKAKLFLGEERTIILVEGPLDGMRLQEAGFYNWVATLGTNFTACQRMLLIKYGISNIYVGYDNDSHSEKNAGEDGWQKIKKTCSSIFNLSKIHLPSGMDFGDMSASQVRELITHEIR